MPHDAHPMGVLVNVMSALSGFDPNANQALRVSKMLSYSFYILFFLVLELLLGVFWHMDLAKGIRLCSKKVQVFVCLKGMGMKNEKVPKN